MTGIPLSRSLKHLGGFLHHRLWVAGYVVNDALLKVHNQNRGLLAVNRQLLCHVRASLLQSIRVLLVSSLVGNYKRPD